MSVTNRNTDPEGTTKVETIKAQLSCHHRVQVPTTASLGDLIECEKCTKKRRATDTRKGPAKRRIATWMSEAPTPADEADAAEARIAELHADALAPVADPTPEAVAAVAAKLEAFKAEAEQPAPYDVMLARDEHRAVKEWRAAGSVGEPPATPNLAAMNEAHAAGRPRTGTTTAKKAATPRTVHPRRAQANKIKAAQPKRGAGRKLSADELDAYIRKVRATEGTGDMGDELEYAYYVEGIAISRGRWAAAWAATDEAPSAAAE